MNARIFMDYYHEIDFPSLFARAVESDDDVGTTLRIHLLCERMVEAWICACCDCQDLFGRDKNKLLSNVILKYPWRETWESPGTYEIT